MWSSRVPCEKLMRAASIPARINSLTIEGEDEAGPSVAMILVRRVIWPGNSLITDPCLWISLFQVSERRPAGKICHLSQLVLDAQELVVLGRPLSTSGSTCLYLPSIRSDGQIGNGRILGLARTVTDNRGVTRPVGHGHGIQRL